VGKGGRNSARQIPQALGGTSRPLILGRYARAELLELLDYVQAQSPRNANLVAERITKAVERIARDPETHVPEPDVPGLPTGVVARKATVSGYTIRWVYPFVLDGEPNVLVVSIRRGSRRALDDPAYLLRWLEEHAGNPKRAARSSARSGRSAAIAKDNIGETRTFAA
jgi:plasmid stabilization system protein ParE